MNGFTLFISDLHLQQETPHITQNFIHFLQNKATYADALYILGDFFEAWIGDDDRTPYHQDISARLSALAKQGVAIYFMHGNRDFMIGKRFAKQSGFTLLSDPCSLDIYGLRILLSHGDLLCTLDEQHQKYRRIVLHPLFQKTILLIPLFLRRHIAKKLRQQSQQHHRYTTRDIGDVTPKAVDALMQQHQSPLLIHGHTHRPRIHTVKFGKRIVLGAWHDNAAYLQLFPNGHFELTSAKIDGPVSAVPADQ
ncbi:MAG: UDP-2,3-diacylglucosamine diphosphatase [Coxiella sp. RIFCSPHIGHO2_12_FULL_42_15]|nr:MAG: UDP-2,3-diacylglucosamine diphosphatase [Coxiella sp. RIFCSPHIGHO2_12_FULL_42_15]